MGDVSETTRQVVGHAVAAAAMARTPTESMGEMGSAVTEQFAQALDKWPIEFLGISAAALFAGLVLWIAGAKLVRPIFITLGLLGGGFLGALIVPGFGSGGADGGEPLLGLPPATAGLIIGGVLGLIVASLLFRLAVAGSAGSALGAAGRLGGFEGLGGGDTGALAVSPSAAGAGSGTAGSGNQVRSACSSFSASRGRLMTTSVPWALRLDSSTRPMVVTVVSPSTSLIFTGQ